ncbi:MAG TPA: histidine phosphatase family protein [Thermoanaerobaculales bacterium]|nr:histidine phosphatase family protein [Thermoanaerobaculales bacterium]HQN95180.1 histidine phosphatase family protein [Thermoanaerobaculales bacterium]HQP42866.1 histidine phosphatase family protein [Thermoanaerobaculales bacterium]
MLELLIMRHAKSDWDAAATDDHERPLAERGVKAARKMGRFLARDEMVPGLVISSTALRARTTAELAAAAGKWRCPVEHTAAFYGADPSGVLAEIASRTAPPRLLVVGHEPTWSQLVSLLIGGGAVRMATAAVACVEIEADGWDAVTPGSGRLAWLITPRLLQAGEG